MKCLSEMVQMENGGTGGHSYTDDEKVLSGKRSYAFRIVNYEEYH